MVIIMYICICNGITDNEIRNAIDSYHHELNVHHNDSLSKNHDCVINDNNDNEAATSSYANLRSTKQVVAEQDIQSEQAESNLKIKPQNLSELDYIKEKLDFDFCCGKCQCMVNDIINNYNKVDIKS